MQLYLLAHSFAKNKFIPFCSWMSRFQKPDGKIPMGSNTAQGAKSVTLDYDRITAFKAIPMWQQAKATEAKTLVSD